MTDSLLRRTRDPHALFGRVIKAWHGSPAKTRAENDRRWLRLGFALGDAYRAGRLSDREYDDLVSKMP